MKEKYQERSQQLQQELQSRLQQQQQEAAAKEERERKERMALVRKVEAIGGVWQSIEQMNESLSLISSKKLNLDAIKAQMTYRKKILRQSVAAKDFAFSESGRQFRQEELKQKLASLITNNTAELAVDHMDETENE